MAGVWLILEVIMLFFYFDLPKVMSKNDDDLCVSTDNSVNSDSVVKGEKQKLRNINGSYRKLQRTNSVMDDWHLAKGWFTLCQWHARHSVDIYIWQMVKSKRFLYSCLKI